VPGALYSQLTGALVERYAELLLSHPAYAWRLDVEEAAEPLSRRRRRSRNLDRRCGNNLHGASGISCDVPAIAVVRRVGLTDPAAARRRLAENPSPYTQWAASIGSVSRPSKRGGSQRQVSTDFAIRANSILRPGRKLPNWEHPLVVSMRAPYRPPRYRPSASRHLLYAAERAARS
jgi:hypothetical protein